MCSVHDVAAYILRKKGEMTTMKLQKLVYYSQAWSLVWDEKPLFKEEIQAWANGPVVPQLYNAYRGEFLVSKAKYGNPAKLKPHRIETIDAVLKTYGDKPAHWLSELTHREDPWRKARKGLAPGERENKVICHASMNEYYDGLYSKDKSPQ